MDFLRFALECRALDTFLGPFLCAVDLVMLRRVCRALRSGIVVERGNHELIVLALKERYYWLVANHLSGGPHLDGSGQLYLPCSGRDFEAQKVLVMGYGVENMAFFGNVELLKWAKESNEVFGPELYKYAAEKGHMNVIKWLEENGVAWDATCRYTCQVTAAGGHLEALKWLREKCFYWDKDTCTVAATNNQFEVLKWARANGCPWDGMICKYAAYVENLEMLKWARANGAPWYRDVCTFLAQKGNLEMLKWARANGAPWDEGVCNNAAVNGQLEVLKWARANGAPWSDCTCTRAALCEDPSIIEWLRANGCPWDPLEVCQTAVMENNLEVLEWAILNGAKCDSGIYEGIEKCDIPERMKNWGFDHGIVGWYDFVDCEYDCRTGCENCWKKYCDENE